MIEGVERLGAKLEPGPLVDRKLLVQTNVPILQSGPVDQPTHPLLEIELPLSGGSEDSFIVSEKRCPCGAVRARLASRHVHQARLEPLAIWAKCLNMFGIAIYHPILTAGTIA